MKNKQTNKKQMEQNSICGPEQRWWRGSRAVGMGMVVVPVLEIQELRFLKGIYLWDGILQGTLGQ